MAVETAFRKHYDQVGEALYELLKSKDPKERQLGVVLVHLEYENLRTALKLSLNAQISVINFYKALSECFDTTQDHSRGLDLGKAVLKSLEKYPSGKLEGILNDEFAAVIDDIAMRQLLLKQYKAAEVSYRKGLSILLKNTNYDRDTIKRKSASVYHQLGMVAQGQRQWEQAERYYRQALQIKIEYNDRSALAKTYHQLGMVAQEQEQRERVEQYYLQALQIKIEYNDRSAQADTYHNLGGVAQVQKRWEEAKQYYQQALQIFIEFNRVYEQASLYLNLGGVAQEQKQWKQAKQYDQQALQIFIAYNDRHSQALVYYNLGMAAQIQGEREQAREYLILALNMLVEYQDQHNIGRTLRYLALLWKINRDVSIPAAIASIFEVTQEEVEARLYGILESIDDEIKSSEQGE